MQSIGNFIHFYIARFEASSIYVILKCRILKTLLDKLLKFANA